jgi:hypothetical protein
MCGSNHREAREIDIAGQSPQVRAAADSCATTSRPTLRALSTWPLSWRLRADDEVLLAGLLVPTLRGDHDRGRACRVFGEPALRLAGELRRVEDSGIPRAGTRPAAKPEQAGGLRLYCLASSASY